MPPGSHVFLWIKFLLAICVEGNLETISAKLFAILSISFKKEDV